MLKVLCDAVQRDIHSPIDTGYAQVVIGINVKVCAPVNK